MSSLSIVDAALEQPSRECWVDQESTLTFAQVAEQVTPLISALSDLGLGPSMRVPRVAWVGSKDREHIFGLYALLELGLSFTVLHPRWPERQRDRILRETGAEWLLDGSRLGPLNSTDSRTWTPGQANPRARDKALATGQEIERPSRAARRGHEPGEIIIFTSGSSGHPKGARLSYRALLAAAVASERRLGWCDRDRWLLSLLPAHIGGLSIVTRTLHGRRTLVNDPASGFEAREFVSTVERHAVTLVSLVPTMLQRVVRSGLDAPQSLRLVLVGGARTPLPLLREASCLGWPVVATYGLTEACSQVATQNLDRESQALRSSVASVEPLLGDDAPRARASCAHVRDPIAGVGPPLEGIELRLRHESGDLVSTAPGRDSDSGVLELRGAALFSGYLERSEPGADSVTAFGLGLSADGWFSTGDWGRIDAAGDLHLLDRRTDLIITGGENVYPAQVESLLERHPLIEQACVIGLSDDTWGQTVGAVVRLRNGTLDRPVDLDSFLDLELASFQRPRRLIIVSELPSTPAGKLDRLACAALLRS